VSQQLTEWALRNGYRVAWGPLSDLDAAHAEIAELRRGGAIDPCLFKHDLRFSPPPESSISGARTVIVVAVPRHAHLVVFEFGNGRFQAIVPPTYCRYDSLPGDVGWSLADAIRAKVWALKEYEAPLKPLATRLGLASYGRNNLTYVTGMGSYLQLMGFLTEVDLGPCPSPRRERPSVLPECQECDACRAACPMGAISDDRFLIRAERCLTLFNERPDPWPQWIPTSAHNSLVGCMLCQEVCPRNRGLFTVEVLHPAFDPEETTTVLEQEFAAHSPIWMRIRRNLQVMGLQKWDAHLGRNLAALLASRGRRRDPIA
jgi:epoxyqueuosine reductase